MRCPIALYTTLDPRTTQCIYIERERGDVISHLKPYILSEFAANQHAKYPSRCPCKWMRKIQTQMHIFAIYTPLLAQEHSLTTVACRSYIDTSRSTSL